MSVTAESRVPALNCDNASETPQETLSEVDKEGAETQNDPPAEVPVKRKRGRPPKISVEVHVALRQAWYIFPKLLSYLSLRERSSATHVRSYDH